MKRLLLILALLALPLTSAVSITAPTSDISAAQLPTSVQAQWTGNSSSYAVSLTSTNGTVDEQNLSTTSTSWQLAAGDYTLTVSADNDTESTQFRVSQEQNLELGISVGAQEYDVGETVELTATSNQPASAQLDIKRDGQTQETYNLNVDGSVSLIYIPEQAGSFSAQLSADGQQASTNWQVTQVQQLSIDFSHDEPTVNNAATFSASASGGVSPYTYQWLFSDDTASTGQETDHYFFSAGEHNATLIVTDDEGTQKSLTKSFSVAAETYDLEVIFRDNNQNFIDQLTVELSNNQTDKEQETDDTGAAEFTNLPVGNYTLRVTQASTTYLNTTIELTKDTNELYDLDYGTAQNTSQENTTTEENSTQSETDDHNTTQDQTQDSQAQTKQTKAQQETSQLESAREDALTTIRETKFNLRLSDKKDAALNHLELYKRFDQATTTIEDAQNQQAITQALADVPEAVKISAETSTISYPQPEEIQDAMEAYLDAKGVSEEDKDKYRYNIEEYTSNVSIETTTYTATISYPNNQETHTIVEKKITSPQGSKHIEVIDKSFAQDVSELTINGEYDVLEADPILRFTSNEYSYSARVAAGEPGQTVVVPEIIKEKPLLSGLVSFELGASSLTRTAIYVLILGLFVAGIVAGKKINEHRESQALFEDFYELASTAVELANNGQAAQAAQLAPDIKAIHEELPAQQRAQSKDIVEHLQAQADKHEFETTVNEIYTSVKQAGGDVNEISSAYEHAIEAYEQLPEQLQDELSGHLNQLESYLDEHIST